MKTGVSRLFDELNKRYWRGRLPRYRVIRRAKIAGNYLGLCNNQTKTVLVRRDLVGKALRLTLLHEMCHVGPNVGFQHGPHFLRRLRRLARLGEPKVLDEIEEYDGTAVERKIEALKAKGKLGPETPWRDFVLSDLESAAEDSWASRRRWTTIRRYLADRHKMSVARFQRCAPWAEREWRQLSQEARGFRRAEKVMEARERLHEFAHVATSEDLKRTRQTLGITRAELAWMLRVPRVMVARWEAGLQRIPSFVVGSPDEAQAQR